MLASTRRRIGRTRLEVTVLGLGGAPLGNLLTPVAEGEALRAVEEAYERGVRYFDVAPLYGHGLAEHRFGHVLRGHDRDSFVLSTKVGRLLTPSRSGAAPSAEFAEPLPFDVVNRYSADAIRRSVEDSLQRLGMSRIDILFIHNIDPANHPPDGLEALFREAMEEAYPALDRLRREGAVGAVGVGNNFAEMCERFARAGDFDCFLLAGRYTLLEIGALDSFLPLCAARGTSVVIGGPFNSGILASGSAAAAHYNYRQAPPAIIDRVRRIEAVCRAFDVPLAAAALQFPLAHPSVASVIPGARSSHEVAMNARLVEAAIPDAFWDSLKSEGLLRIDAPTPVDGRARP